jgi:hypothetical protein
MRSGTTFLHNSLQSHPDIQVTNVKEHQFLSWRWSAGMKAYRAQLPLRWPSAVAPKLIGRRLNVDSTPYYLFHPLAAARAAAVFPQDVKMIVLLREPALRAWSHYRLSLCRGHEHLGFVDALAAEPERLSCENARIASGIEIADAPHQVFSYVSRGRYAEQIARWWSFFPQSQFLLLKSADLFADPQAVINRVCGFLELPCVTLGNLDPQNALPPAELPAAVRTSLERVFDGPNQELTKLTGISFGC